MFYTDGVSETRDRDDNLFDLQRYLAGCRGRDAEQISCGIQDAASLSRAARPTTTSSTAHPGAPSNGSS